MTYNFLLAMDVKLHMCMYEGVECMIIRVIMLIMSTLCMVKYIHHKKVFSNHVLNKAE